MTYRPGEFYRLSGKIGPQFFVLATVGLGVSAVTAIAYAYLAWYNPLIYINALACIGMGLLIGVGAGVTAKLGKCRSTTFAQVLGLAMGVVAVYVSWVFWLNILAGKSGLNVWAWEPQGMWKLILRISETGVWSIKSTTPTGYVLLGIWGIEAAIIVIAGGLMARSGVADEVFDEESGTWLEEKKVIGPLEPVVQKGQLIRAVTGGNFMPLLELGKIAFDATTFTEVELLTNPRKSLMILSIREVGLSTDSEGKVQRKEEWIVRRLVVSSETFEGLLENVGKKKFEMPAAAAPVSV